LRRYNEEEAAAMRGSGEGGGVAGRGGGSGRGLHSSTAQLNLSRF